MQLAKDIAGPDGRPAEGSDPCTLCPLVSSPSSSVPVYTSLSLPTLEERPHLPVPSQDPELLFPVEALVPVILTPVDAEVDVPLLLYLCGPLYHAQGPY